MRPLSQHYARRLLELVCDNNASLSDADHVDHDVWARTHPPVRGLNFRDRETAACCLRAGGLGAVPSSPPQLPDSRPTAVIPQHDFEDTSPSRLFNDIGPSVSVANAIDAKNRNVTAHLFPEHDSYHHNPTESEHISTSSPPQSSIESQPNTVSSLPSTTTSLPLPPLPSLALERNILSGNKLTHPQFQPNSMPIPPPPPPLPAVQSYGSAPAVPPPPSSPPPRIDEKPPLRNSEDTSPVSETELRDINGHIHDEFSDLADSSVPSIRTDWIHGYQHPPTTVVEDDDDLDVGLGARPVESDEEHEYVRGVHVMANRNMVGRRSEPLLG